VNHMTVTTEHLRALLGSGPHSELVAVGGEIEIYVPDEGELRIAAESLSEMIAELGG